MMTCKTVMCSVCGNTEPESLLIDGNMPVHGSPGPLPHMIGCPGSGKPPRNHLLLWQLEDGYLEARIGIPGDCVYFSLIHYSTCYRRGKWRLVVEVCGGENHTRWGCFDEADQPMRYYHDETRAKQEAEAIAQVLWKDRFKQWASYEGNTGQASGDRNLV